MNGISEVGREGISELVRRGVSEGCVLRGMIVRQRGVVNGLGGGIDKKDFVVMKERSMEYESEKG